MSDDPRSRRVAVVADSLLEPRLAELRREGFGVIQLPPAGLDAETVGAWLEQTAEHVAELYARAGLVDEAMQWLETAYREHDTELNRLKEDPIFIPLRRDRRFADLIRRLGFPS